MIISVSAKTARGRVKAIASKSVAHRLLICAAFAHGDTRIRCEETSKDIEATAACLEALGARIRREPPYYHVTPVAREDINKNASLPCGESGSTLRFLIPVVAALGAEARFVMEGRLPQRPLSPLREELEAHGVGFLQLEANVLKISGRLTGKSFSLAGNVSSQFISGMLFGLSLLNGESRLHITKPIESAPYVDITAEALSLFGAAPEATDGGYTVSACGRLVAPSSLEVEGDWSNAAFPLCLGIIGKESVTVTGLDPESAQGDRSIVELLRRFGGKIHPTPDNKGYTAERSRLCGIDIDASQIPDLVPVLATVATVAEGQTVIRGASRLRLKESDRLESTRTMLCGLGADVSETEDGLIINGRPSLRGGRVSAFNDHRIAMSAAVAAAVCESAVTIEGAEAVEKSYPNFWGDMRALGASVLELD